MGETGARRVGRHRRPMALSVPRRFLVASAGLESDGVDLEGDELHHALRVLRVREGELVEAVDGGGRAREAIVRLPDRESVRLELGFEAPSREPSRNVILASALLDSDAFDLVVRDATQLGVAGIVALRTARVRPALAEAAPKRLERWRRIARESIKQCGRARVPDLGPAEELTAFLDRLGGRAGAALDGAGRSGEGLASSDSPFVLFVGPEGGWTDQERGLLVDRGVVLWSLGERVLRAETATVAALARLNLS